MNIRIANQGDFDVIRDITKNTIAEIYPHYYPQGVVEFFLSLHNDEAIKNDIDNNRVYVALSHDKIIATVTVDGNEINRLFVLTEYQKHGYGTEILNCIEKIIFQKYDVIQLHASLPGKSLYLNRGYEFAEYRKKEVDYGDWICIDIFEKRKANIRPLTKTELINSLELVWKVFCEYEAVDYPESGKQAFYQAIHSEEYLNMLTAYGAFEKDVLIGIIATRNSGTHVSLFFVDGQYQRQGVGRSLWNAMLKENTSDIITVHSSLYAKDIYKKLGFVQTSDVVDDCGIRYITMEYKKL